MSIQRRSAHDEADADYTLQNALGELEWARADCAELRAMIDEFADHYANDCKCKLSSGFVCIVHRSRALLARLDAEGKS